MSEKFPSVKALKTILGIKEGTELVFDYGLAKYVSRVESEDIGDDTYYYSGSAVAIDPYVVKHNVGEFFEYTKEEEKIDLHESKEGYETQDEVKPYHTHEPKNFPEMDTSEWVEWTKGDLVMTCHNCGNVDVVAEGIEGGIQSVLPVDNHNEIRLVCSQCNSAMSLHFAKSADGEVKEYVEKVPEDDTEDQGEPLMAESAEVEEIIKGENDESTQEN